MVSSFLWNVQVVGSEEPCSTLQIPFPHHKNADGAWQFSPHISEVRGVSFHMKHKTKSTYGDSVSILGMNLSTWNPELNRVPSATASPFQPSRSYTCLGGGKGVGGSNI